MEPVDSRRRILPCLLWIRRYNGETLAADSIAAIIVSIMLIPQSLAYALIAGLPPEMGLYACIFPLTAYAIFGSSRSLAVGPVAVVSLMTAAALAKVGEPGSDVYLAAAVILASMVGLLLLIAGLLRFGFLANLLSQPVVAGFISASAIVIALGQVQHIVGIPVSGQNLLALFISLQESICEFDGLTQLFNCHIRTIDYCLSFLGSFLSRQGAKTNWCC